MLSPIQNLYYAIGELAYAMASADGTVQKEERQKFHDIVAAELRMHQYGFDISSIIFQVMDKEKQNAEDSYNWGLHQIKLNSHYLSPELKHTSIRIMEKIAAAFPPVTSSEHAMLDRFRADIAPIHGDPTFYRKSPES